MKFRRLLLITLLIGFSNTGNAAIEVKTIGARSCGEWVKYRAAHRWNEVAIKARLAGYLSGIAAGLGNDFLTYTDAASVNSWMDNYCMANPLNTIYDGGLDLTLELIKKMH